MDIGMVGLGRMGANMVRRLAKGGAKVRAFDVSPMARAALHDAPEVVVVDSLEGLAQGLPAPRVIWMMLPAGAVSDTTITSIAALLESGDTLVDGANAYYREAIAHARALAARGIHFVDAGVSGGVWGLQNGYALMLGGTKEAVERVTPFVRLLAPAPDTGWLHCGPSGAGHFVKMVHNGIEYGMMQAYAEGFALMEAKKDFQLDLAAIAETWRHGSVVRSWLLDLTTEFLSKDTQLAQVEPFVADSGEGRWTALESVELGIPTPVITLALMARFASQGKGDYASKLLAMMRNMFGGHAIHRTS
ncbi:MAG TPA: decarboxylating 6-phosphogluconate dehydrogenase [Burkholderiales bacterium]|nr:decarboxylating 6-phosphogluconate dehydrogenase [Burkholderiales bacterium]